MKNRRILRILLLSSALIPGASLWASDVELKDFKEVKIRGAKRISDILSHQALSTIWKKNEDIWETDKKPKVPEEENITLEQYAALRLKSTTPAVTKGFEDLKLIELQHRMAESAVAAEAERLLNQYLCSQYQILTERKEEISRALGDLESSGARGKKAIEEYSQLEKKQAEAVSKIKALEAYLSAKEPSELLDDRNEKGEKSERDILIHSLKSQAYQIINVVTTPHSVLALLLKPSFIEEEEFKTFYEQAEGLRYFRQEANELERVKKRAQQKLEGESLPQDSVQVLRPKESLLSLSASYKRIARELSAQGKFLQAGTFRDLQNEARLKKERDKVKYVKLIAKSPEEIAADRLEELEEKIHTFLSPLQRKPIYEEMFKSAQTAATYISKNTSFWAERVFKYGLETDEAARVLEIYQNLDEEWKTHFAERAREYAEKHNVPFFFEQNLEEKIKEDFSFEESPEGQKDFIELFDFYSKNKEKEKIKNLIKKLRNFRGMDKNLLVRLEPYTQEDQAYAIEDALLQAWIDENPPPRDEEEAKIKIPQYQAYLKQRLELLKGKEGKEDAINFLVNKYLDSSHPAEPWKLGEKERLKIPLEAEKFKRQYGVENKEILENLENMLKNLEQDEQREQRKKNQEVLKEKINAFHESELKKLETLGASEDEKMRQEIIIALQKVTLEEKAEKYV